MTAPARPGDRWEQERRRVSHQILFWARVSFALVGTMPWWLPLSRALLPLGILGEAMELPFMLMCHRLPERTIEIAGVAMPLCSRCSGIFSGLALGAALCWPRLTLRRARLGLLAAGLLMLADVLTQDLGVHPVWHATRLVTGTLLGWVASAALMTAIIRERGLVSAREAGEAVTPASER